MKPQDTTSPGPHSLTIGPTRCGKTTLWAALSKDFRRAGWPVVVVDKFRDPRWGAERLFTDATKMVNWVDATKLQQSQVIVDESGTAMKRFNPHLQRLTTEFGHHGLNVHLIGQYPTQLDPTVRTNCTRLILFFCTVGLDLLIDEWGDDRLGQARELKRGEFLVKDKMGYLRRGRITDYARATYTLGGPE